ncbi:MAG: alpha/beta hydrolase [Kofleriaceae bacterium]
MPQLHHELLTAAGASPARWLLLTHGIFGSGGNWRSIARKLARARPDVGCVLVDLRNHGRSPAPPGPHDLDACAGDVDELVAQLAAAGHVVVAAAGHSFGGKVIAALRARRQRRASDGSVRQWWTLDSSPSARPDAWAEPDNSVRAVLETLEALPATLASRAQFEAEIEGAGHAPSLAHWLALSLEPDGDGVRLRLPLPAVREMLTHYYQTDLWASLREPAGGEVHVVIAARSSTVSPADREELRRAPTHLHAHLVDADHWLHIDAPDAVVELFARHLPSA